MEKMIQFDSKVLDCSKNFFDEVAMDVEKGYYVASTGEKRENDIYHLTHLLLSSLVDSKRRIEAGYNLNDVRVDKIVQAILNANVKTAVGVHSGPLIAIQPTRCLH